MKTIRTKKDGAESDGFKREGRPFTLRLLPDEEAELRKKMQEADIPYRHGRRWGSFGGFIVLAALQADLSKPPAKARR